MINKKIKAVLFDFDGVLADTMEDNFKAWRRAYLDYGVQIKREDYFPLEGLIINNVAKILSDKYGINEDPEIVAKLKKEYYLEDHHFRFYPDVEKLVNCLNDIGLLLAIVSASSKERLKKTVSTDFLNKFKTVISGDDCDKGKPDPEPYLKAMERLNVEPKECLIIENAPLGIKSAKASGAYCIVLTTTLDKKYLYEANKILKNHKELKENILLFINSS